LPSKPETAEVQFNLRDYRAADFERLWQIDQLCFTEGISYTQMELTGFITRRNAITLVADFNGLHHPEIPPVSAPQAGEGWTSGAAGAGVSEPAAVPQGIAGFAIAQPVQGKSGRIMTLDVVPEASRMGLASLLVHECERRLSARGCQLMYLETAVDNEPALRLYRKLGYQILQTLPDYYASSLDAFLMWKPL
jgi:ribosomal protein S18 acetylase RimI-like enzyme